MDNAARFQNTMLETLLGRIGFTSTEAHPYYPLGLEIRNYQPNESPLLNVVAVFSFGLAISLCIILGLAIYKRPSMSYGDRLSIAWFALSGILHCFFEGYFVTHHNNMGPAQDVIGQMWKEYAKSDSRYLVSDSFVVSIEAITVILWGPLCLLVAYLTTVNHSLRHPLRVIVCMAHLYGDTLYYATSLYDYYFNGIAHSRPEALYFWVYYFLMNFVWIVIPGYLLYNSVRLISRAMEVFENQKEKSKKL